MHILTMLKYGMLSGDPTGFLISSSCELLRLEAGVSGPLFRISPHLRICLTDTWVSHCWYQCVQRGIDIREDIYDFPERRGKDQSLMDLFLSAGYRENELATLNQCRLHLKVIFLSDICNAQGTAIETQFWTGSGQADWHSFSWPRAHKPTSKEWLLWQQALSKGLNLGRAQQLPLPLGKWRQNIREANRWFMNVDGIK